MARRRERTVAVLRRPPHVHRRTHREVAGGRVGRPDRSHDRRRDLDDTTSGRDTHEMDPFDPSHVDPVAIDVSLFAELLGPSNAVATCPSVCQYHVLLRHGRHRSHRRRRNGRAEEDDVREPVVTDIRKVRTRRTRRFDRRIVRLWSDRRDDYFNKPLNIAVTGIPPSRPSIIFVR